MPFHDSATTIPRALRGAQWSSPLAGQATTAPGKLLCKTPAVRHNDRGTPRLRESRTSVNGSHHLAVYFRLPGVGQKVAVRPSVPTRSFIPPGQRGPHQPPAERPHHRREPALGDLGRHDHHIGRATVRGRAPAPPRRRAAQPAALIAPFGSTRAIISTCVPAKSGFGEYLDFHSATAARRNPDMRAGNFAGAASRCRTGRCARADHGHPRRPEPGCRSARSRPTRWASPWSATSTRSWYHHRMAALDAAVRR